MAKVDKANFRLLFRIVQDHLDPIDAYTDDTFLWTVETSTTRPSQNKLMPITLRRTPILIKDVDNSDYLNLGISTSGIGVHSTIFENRDDIFVYSGNDRGCTYDVVKIKGRSSDSIVMHATSVVVAARRIAMFMYDYEERQIMYRQRAKVLLSEK